jgi:FHS family L-fucose permease-like MFS transporter
MKQPSSQASIPTNYGALGTLVMVFFFWGFIAASNSMLIPFCKTHFNLTQFESQLIGSSFYGAYFIGSLIIFVVSNLLGYDIINRIGYKRGIVYGLLISVVGALLIIPSANAESFNAILGALFIVALGFSLQQTCAQPFTISLGDPATGSHRLNLGGGVNSFGTTLGPIIVSFFLFGSVGSAATEVTVKNINNLYIIVAGVFAAVALIFHFSKLPEGRNDEPFESTRKASASLLLMTGLIIAIIIVGMLTEIPKLYLLLGTLVVVVGILFYGNQAAATNESGWGAMKYPQLIYGMLGIFVYVGVEVTIDNNFGALLKQKGYFNADGLDESQISQYISLYWGSLMIGRWTGAISVFNLKGMAKTIATMIVPFVAFGVILLVNFLYGNPIDNLLPYAIVIAIAVAAFFFGQEKPVKTLLVLSVLAAAGMIIGSFTTGMVSVFSLVAGGLCCSIMWPCIFSLSIAGLGKYTSEGSALLIMMILGGAIIPPLQGVLGDGPIGLHKSYLFAALCFAILAWLAIKMKSVLKQQGIDFDQQIEGGH